MIFCRFRYRDDSTKTPRYGIVESHQIKEISPNPFQEFEIAEEEIPFSSTLLLAPVLPSKIIGVGLNYNAHVKEMGVKDPEEPVLFLKPSTSLIGPEDSIHYPKTSERVDYEGELAVVIKKRGKDIALENVNEYILGYSCFNDITARDLQKKDGQWSRAKSFDTFSALGPWIISDLDPSNLQIESYLNGELKQNGKTSDMIFNVPHLVSFISKVMTLEPGDVIATGTPPGIGPMQKGDSVDIRIEGIGILRNTVQ